MRWATRSKPEDLIEDIENEIRKLRHITPWHQEQYCFTIFGLWPSGTIHKVCASFRKEGWDAVLWEEVKSSIDFTKAFRFTFVCMGVYGHDNL